MTISRLADEAGIDGILVGDSLGMVVMGFNSTLPVTMGMVAHHLKAVLSARPRSLVVADMPFLSYEVSKEEALRNAGRLIKMGADAVKLEGGVEVAGVVEILTRAGIPVMGHIGLNPRGHFLMKGGLEGLRPTRSWKTRTCLSHADPEPMQIVGISSLLVISSATSVAVNPITIENALAS